MFAWCSSARAPTALQDRKKDCDGKGSVRNLELFRLASRGGARTQGGLDGPAGRNWRRRRRWAYHLPRVSDMVLLQTFEWNCLFYRS
jgi:hypothetical protein